ncbi:MAG: 30S ribosomal protein S20 [Alphaproteobacteria bacterium]|nr:30S ribosomal protein S20 [Alphaproteobacteria bacterium]
MAHHKSAKKRIRRNEKRRVINHARISRVRTFVKRVESAIAGGDKSAANDALKLAQPEMHRGVSRGVLHKNTASRKISRLSKRIKAMAA